MLKFNKIIAMKCISKPVINQLFSILNTLFFHKETRITVLILNRQHVFHLESETLWCSGYKKTFKLGEPQPRPTIYVVLLSQLLHRTSVLISSFSFCYMDFLRFNLTRMFKIVIRFVPAGAEVDFLVLLHSLLCGV